MKLIFLFGLAAVLALILVRRARGRSRSESPVLRSGTRPGGVPQTTRASASAGTESTVVPSSDAAPASLLDLQWQTAESLPEARRELMLAELQKAPPPPRAFHRLVSPDFVATASSADLAELVIGVPLAATQVLARANSAFYGLQQPVGSVGHAITYLGLNSVRTICMQYMMEASFQAHSPELKQRFDQLWSASAIASELSQRLAGRLQLPDASGLVTEVALSSLGHFAAATLMPREGTAASTQGLLTRAWSEQAQLGAPAAEIGALLMRAWDLPEPLVENVRAIDRMLVTPAGPLEPQRGLRLAVGYLSARLGERLARGQDVDLADFEQSVMAGDDYFHLRTGLPTEQLQRLREALQAPEVARGLQAMLATLREPAANRESA
jgi:HD-like signal output (HDOD) protein